MPDSPLGPWVPPPVAAGRGRGSLGGLVVAWLGRVGPCAESGKLNRYAQEIGCTW